MLRIFLISFFLLPINLFADALLSSPKLSLNAQGERVIEFKIQSPRISDQDIILKEYKSEELLTQEIMKKYKVVICGPNTLSAYLQSLHMGFQSLKVQKGATEIYDHLKTISTRFAKHFDNS